jgi:2-keto-3-deoxy-L-rhamnonate aldolase RhmA
LKNSLKEKLKKGKVVFGITLGIGSPEVADVLGDIDFDYINFDTQHTSLSVETVQNMMAAMSYSQSTPIMRVVSNNLGQINRALDIGAHGVIVPLVNSKEDAEKAVYAARYSPKGGRSWGPRRVALRDPEYTETADKEVMVIPQIESKIAVDRIDEILSVEGLDAIFVGPFDLSMSLGVFRKFNSPRFLEAIKTVISSCRKHSIAPGLLAPAGPLEASINQGFTMINLGGDSGFMAAAAKDALDKARAAVKK